MPIHPLAFGIFMVWQIAFNVLGHVGYEFYPRRLMDSPMRCILNTATNHVMHHETLRETMGSTSISGIASWAPTIAITKRVTVK